MRALLDVNVLIALLDAAHQHHAAARDWLQKHSRDGWASCPTTQNGCIRIPSQPRYPGAQPPAAIAERLGRATRTNWHRFWPDDTSLLTPQALDWGDVLGSRQITDVYLLALAVKHEGRLVTFDRAIPVHAVTGAQSRHLITL